MHSVTFQHINQQNAAPLKSKNHYEPRRRDNLRRQSILAAVREWELTLPGQAQDVITQLVAEQWAKEGGRGITVNKQNLYRYLKNETNSSKYMAYAMQLANSIIMAMPLEIAKKHGWRLDERTEEEKAAYERELVEREKQLVANAVKECCEAHQAKLLGAPLQKLEKEIREAAIALFSLLPSDTAGPLLASIGAVAPQFL